MLDISHDFEVRLRAEPHRYQREVFIEEISSYAIEDFLLQCEIFKNKLLFSKSKSKRELLAPMKKKLQLEQFEAPKKADIRESFAKMEAAKRLSSGSITAEIEAFVQNLHSSEKSCLINGAEVDIKDVLLMEGRDLEFQIFTFLRLRWPELFALRQDTVPQGFFDRVEHRRFDLSAEVRLKPLARIKFEKTLRSKIDIYKLESLFESFFANPKWTY